MTLSRQQRLEELYVWAKERPLDGIESVIRVEALRRYRCTEITAASYAEAVRRMVQEARPALAPVQ